MKKCTTAQQKEKESRCNIMEEKIGLKEIPVVTAIHLANGHFHLDLCEPVTLFQLLFNDKIYSLIACETE